MHIFLRFKSYIGKFLKISMKQENRKLPKNFSREQLAQLAEQMSELIYANTLIALEAEAALEAGNDLLIPLNLRDQPFDGAKCFGTIQNSLALNLTICLARLFEEPSAKKQHPDYSDVASIPLLILTLRKPECRDALCESARRWTPNLDRMEDVHEATCKKAIDEAIQKYEEAKKSPEVLNTLETLSHFRNMRVAHSLHGKIVKAIPKYNDLFRLMDIARDITTSAILAIDGNSHDLKDAEIEYYREAKAFWEPALTGIKDTLEE